jgi:hypothetical protein
MTRVNMGGWLAGWGEFMWLICNCVFVYVAGVLVAWCCWQLGHLTGGLVNVLLRRLANALISQS